MEYGSRVLITYTVSKMVELKNGGHKILVGMAESLLFLSQVRGS